MKSLLSPTRVKAYALAISEEFRNGKFTRVSQSKLDNWDARLKSIIIDDIKRHPSIGKTLK